MAKKEFSAKTISLKVISQGSRSRLLIEKMVMNPDDKPRNFIAIKKEWSRDETEWFPKTSILLDYDNFQLLFGYLKDNYEEFVKFLEASKTQE